MERLFLTFRMAMLCLVFSSSPLLLTSAEEINYPECDAPQNFQAFINKSGELQLFWEGEQAEREISFFEIQLKNVNQSQWATHLVESGPNELQLPLAKINGDWLIRIRRSCIDELLATNHESDYVETTIENDARNGEEEWCDDISNPIAYSSGGGIFIEWAATTALTNLGEGIYIEFCIQSSKDPQPICQNVFAGQLEHFFGGLDYLESYTIEMTLIIPTNGGIGTYECPTVDLGPVIIEHDDDPEEEEEPEINLPVFSCGDAFTVPVVDQDPLPVAVPGDVFNIGGFPILVETVTGGGGLFSGTGIVPLPFSSKTLRVEFNSIGVNKNGEVFSGQVLGIADDPENYPEIPLNPVVIGDEICQPTGEPGFDEDGIYQPTGQPYDANGFGPNGTYAVEPPYTGYQEGDPLDPNYNPNGFGADSIHAVTLTPYNENGCSMLGFTEDGAPCDPAGPGPYYWTTETGETIPTIVGTQFADSIATDLRAMIVASLNSVLNMAQDSMDITMDKCNGVRDEVVLQIDELGHDRTFIAGEDDNYIRDGMYQAFTERPKMLTNNDGRAPAQINLEEKHIELYDCDKRFYKFLAWKSIITEQQQSSQIDLSEEALLELIAGFTEAEVQLYTDSTAFANWVFNEVDINVSDHFDAAHGETFSNVMFKNKSPQFIKSSRPALAPYQSPLYAARDNLPIETAMSPEDISFYYRQGFKNINGIHRVYYLEAIAQQRSAMAVSDGPAEKLPVELSKVVAGRTYTLYLDNIKFTPAGAELDIFFLLALPQGGNKLVFELENVDFGPTGFPQGFNPKLKLVNNVEIRLNNAAQLNILGAGNDANTFVNFDCEGFNGMGVEAEIEFCRRYLIPLDPQTMEPKPLETDRVKAYFTTTMPSWGEFVAQLTMDPFVLAKATDIKWVVNNAAIDFSDTENPTGLKFPQNYDSPFVQNGATSPLWKGFYLNQLSVTLPNSFSNDPNTPITAGVHDVIIDDMGFTGHAFLSPILSLNEGNLDGWAFSIEEFELGVVANKLTGGSLKGLINVPILSKGEGTAVTAEDCMEYTATIEADNKYSFKVTPNGTYQANIWKANVLIEENSHILVEKTNDGFHACATLHGFIQMNGQLGEKVNVNIPDLKFNNVVVRNKAPYFSPGDWDVPLAVDAQIAGFGINVNGFALKSGAVENEAIMGLNIGIRLNDDQPGEGQPASDSDSEKPKITALGYVDLVGEMVLENGRQRWRYKDFDINGVYITAANMPGIKNLEGQLVFFDEEDFDTGETNWGTGFRGMLDVEFDLKLQDEKTLGATVVGQFGRIEEPEEFKYFMIDGLVSVGGGIEMGGMKLHAFGGGVTYHMTKSGGPNPLTNNSNPNPQIPNLGVALSGIPYEPDISKSIGISASVCMSLSNEEAFNFNATLGAEFNAADYGGGFSKIYFSGTARAMAPVQIGGDIATFDTNGDPPPGVPVSDAPFTAYLDLEMDFNAGIFDGIMDVYLNYDNGKVRGLGPNNLFGKLEIRLGEPNWYVNMGRPTKPAGMEISIPGLGTGSGVTLNAYFNIGTQLDPMPPLPANVAQLTGASNFMTAENQRASGNGFAFGASLDVSTGDINYLLFYASLEAGIGFDLLLQKYTDAYCINLQDDLGLNGWYASGQAWAYFQGKIGIKVELFGLEKKFEILELAAGVALQAKLPNPFFARGSVGGRYSILGGKIKGDCNFQVEIGQHCQLEGGSELLPVFPIYTDVVPSNGQTKVNTLTTSEIVFGMPINTEFDYDGSSFKLQLDYAELRDSTGAVLYVDKVWSTDNGILSLRPFSTLPANSEITIAANVQILKDGLEIGNEEKVVSFFTDESLDYIPPTNVEFAYPFNGQYNFYIDEYQPNGYREGYIELVTGQPDLLFNIPDGKFLNVKFSYYGSDDWAYAQQVNYDYASSKFSFALPNDMASNKFYTAKLVYADEAPVFEFANGVSSSGRPTPPNTNPPPAGQTWNGSSAVPSAGASNGFESNAVTDGPPNTGNSGGAIEEKVLYQWNFRTSEYASFDDKIAALTANGNPQYVNEKVGFKLETNGIEPFDDVELEGSASIQPLIRLVYNGSNDPWLYPKAANNFYDYVPVYEGDLKLKLFRENSSELPTWAAWLNSRGNYEFPIVANSFSDYTFAGINQFTNWLTLNPRSITDEDFAYVKSQWNDYLLTSSCMADPTNGAENEPGALSCADQIQQLVNELDNSVIYKIHSDNTPNLSMPNGQYKVLLNYYLPGRNSSISTQTIIFSKN